MIISVPKEIAKGEKRIAIAPETIAKLIKIGHSIQIQTSAGLEAGFTDSNYKEAGASILDDIQKLYSSADLILKVQPPQDHPSGKHELEMMKKGSLLVSFFYSLSNPTLAKKAADNGIDIISMDAIPRITRAQRMDALSSQTNLAGYKAVIMAADALHKIFPLMMTAAGTISPARVVILGAGVAGLQAIATAKRLGAVVECSDVRTAVKEQVESLGAKYIEPPGESLEGTGGYAKEASEEYLKKQQETLTEHLKEADVAITTAQVPGRRAPLLITESMVKQMKPGSVIVDMAAGSGGNCALTEPDKTVVVNGVKIIGEVNIISHVAFHASQLYSRNLLSLIEYLTTEGKVVTDLSDEIVQGAMICKDGQVVHESTKAILHAAN